MKLQEGAKRSQEAAERVSALATRMSVQDISKGTERPVKYKCSKPHLKGKVSSRCDGGLGGLEEASWPRGVAFLGSLKETGSFIVACTQLGERQILKAEKGKKQMEGWAKWTIWNAGIKVVVGELPFGSVNLVSGTWHSTEDAVSIRNIPNVSSLPTQKKS